MQVLRGRQSDDRAIENEVVAETAPHVLMHAFRSLCQANPGRRELIANQFPMLETVGIGSDRYADENLWLEPDETGLLVQELEKLRRLCRREEYVESLDGPATYIAWRGAEQPEDFDKWLDDILALLGQSVTSAHMVRLML